MYKYILLDIGLVLIQSFCESKKNLWYEYLAYVFFFVLAVLSLSNIENLLIPHARTPVFES